MRPTIVYIWQKSAGPRWMDLRGEALRERTGNLLTIVTTPGRSRHLLEVACKSPQTARGLVNKFGGRIARSPRDWLKRALRSGKTKPIKIGNRLVISASGDLQTTLSSKSATRKPPLLVIPAGPAFGTGDHATTVLCLRLLERVIRFWGAHAPPRAVFGASAENSCRKSSRSQGRNRQQARRLRSPDQVVDLGTGSGILALAARLLGAKHVIGIDNDPIAISTAKRNSRLNKIRGVQFRVGDVRREKFPRDVDIVTANLFSELLIEILPKVSRSRWLILSGILREQEARLGRALKRNKVDVVERRRRGKWVAILAKPRQNRFAQRKLAS